MARLAGVVHGLLSAMPILSNVLFEALLASLEANLRRWGRISGRRAFRGVFGAPKGPRGLRAIQSLPRVGE